MLDRFGKPIYVGWSSHEMLWLDAALSLPYHQQIPAFRDMAAMSGRSFRAIQTKAQTITVTRAEAEHRARRIMVAGDAHKSVRA